MRHDAPFLVKRYAPMIGRPDSPKLVTIAFQGYSFDEVHRWAVAARQRALDVWSTRQAVFWIERRGQPATRPKRQRAAR
jgi:hypothetical protein